MTILFALSFVVRCLVHECPRRELAEIPLSIPSTLYNSCLEARAELAREPNTATKSKVIVDRDAVIPDCCMFGIADAKSHFNEVGGEQSYENGSVLERANQWREA